ncbi:hypothetical protein Q5P01_024293 [Channa striata]|uniref:Transmembrane protein 174 n=1 Tax=Channa striata TaxID=64152 RepID=A0AA88IQP6_CHASR|nr:hypothetical protein Q5P01_024293 [Channa striata]
MEHGAAAETSRPRNPPALISDSTQTVAPAPRPHQPDDVLAAQKIGATLLFCGVGLALVGVTYTTLGWSYYQASARFEWTQLLGPILIFVGGTFVLSSLCKFSSISRCSCQQQRDEEPLVAAVMQQNSRGRCFTTSGGNEPASPTLCCPPVDIVITKELHQVLDFHVGGIRAAPLSHDAKVDTSEDGGGSRIEETENKGGRGGTWSPPPAYEDIYPSCDKPCVTSVS